MITINKNPESLDKLKVGSSTATPADGNLIVSGNVGVGNSPQSPAGISRYLYVGSSAEAGIVLDDTASNPWEMFTDAGNLKFNYNNTGNALTIASSGLCTFSNGIAFSQTNTSATGASATSTTLNHFESGSWTPRIAGNTSGVKTAGSANAGTYTRIGNLVTATGTVSINGSETIAGEVKLTGLPFTSSSTANSRGAGFVGANSGAVSCTSGFTQIRFVVDPNAAHAWIVQVAADNASYSHTPAVSSSANVALLGIVITYQV